MDERIFRIKVGVSIPAWDAKHRLPISGQVGPECKDSATIYRINSTFMDVTEQPHMMRQWLAGGVFTAAVFCVVFLIFLIFALEESHQNGVDKWSVVLVLQLSAAVVGLGYVALKFGRDELFSLTTRPVRFNRSEKKIYAMRRRRFFSAKQYGDLVWEVPWDNQAFFCIHRGANGSDHSDSYHIRCYQLDKDGMVIRGFAIGREWKDLDGLNDLLCQWNYWCTYMNEGPSLLPKPLLFLTDHENIFESFLYCMYEVGFGVSSRTRVLFLPFFCWMTILRVLSLSTCRPPRWPAEISKCSQISENDPYHQPVGNTPVGWAKTSQAHQNDAYPKDPRCPASGWMGESEGLENAKRWQAEIAPGN